MSHDTVAEPEFYSIIDYTVDGTATQEALAAAFAQIQRDWVHHHPGYRSSRILGSTDGTRLYNIVAWRDEASFREFERDSDTDGRVAAIAQAIGRLTGKAEPRMSGAPRYRLLAAVDPA